MLERISEVQGIGLLHDANGKPHTLRKATLIYGDNGRGKSTLATVLRSAATADSALITRRKTLDGTLVPKVTLQFASGHAVQFSAGAWSERRPELLVFDADFIERNVHSGGAVSTHHRKNLLEFALGEAAVAARTAADQAAGAAKKATEDVQTITAQLAPFHVGMPLSRFEKLPAVADADVQLAALQVQINAAANASAIATKATPVVATEPILDLASIFGILNTSLDDVHATAEETVRRHLEKLANADAENWLSLGTQFDDAEACPYCGQATNDNDLIKAYQTHFNAAYIELKAKVGTLHETATAAMAKVVVDTFAHEIELAAARTAAWSDQIGPILIAFDTTSASAALQQLNAFVLKLVRQKTASPTSAMGSPAELAQAEELWTSVLTPMRQATAAVEAAVQSMVDYKGRLADTDATVLQQQVVVIQMSKQRWQTGVVDLIAKHAAATATATDAEKVKKTERAKLDQLMTATLTKYERSINVLLKNFGASFSIAGMATNFRGTAPRSEYGLLLRGKAVALEGEPPSFATALSEGDKRTLAFAFFVASTLDDVHLASRTVVVDDPMCSLDVNRRHHTKTVLKRIYNGAAQLIVLAHDPYFLRDLRDAFTKADKASVPAVFGLVLAPNDYTTFGPMDIDKECESAYLKHHRVLNALCEGSACDVHAVAKSIRPMLEGYLHRRFPGLVPKSLMFGEVVVEIRNATPPSPLVHAKNLIDELNEINDYAGQFHHDDADEVQIVSTELKDIASRALHVVHTGQARS